MRRLLGLLFEVLRKYSDNSSRVARRSRRCVDLMLARRDRHPSSVELSLRLSVHRSVWLSATSYKNLKPLGFASWGHPELAAKSNGNPSVLLWGKKDPHSDGIADIDLSYSQADEVRYLFVAAEARAPICSSLLNHVVWTWC